MTVADDGERLNKASLALASTLAAFHRLAASVGCKRSICMGVALDMVAELIDANQEAKARLIERIKAVTGRDGEPAARVSARQRYLRIARKFPVKVPANPVSPGYRAAAARAARLQGEMAGLAKTLTPRPKLTAVKVVNPADIVAENEAPAALKEW